MNDGYKSLASEFYDITKPQAGLREIAFYDNIFRERTGPFLEAMCGSGRLLIPLIKKGYQIDGVDNSESMLARCRQRCVENNVQTNLFSQSLQKLSLPKKYDVIFIAVGSIQLIEDRDQAFIALQKLREHLLPNGILLLDTFIPWDLIKPAIMGECFLSPKPYQIIGHKSGSSDNFTIELSGTTTMYAQEQVCVTESTYTKKTAGSVIATEQERLAIRWYYGYELVLFLEKAGFSRVKIYDESFEDNPQALVYEAIK